MRIRGRRGEGSLFFVPALLHSPFFSKVARIRFYLDTGATVTSISEVDAVKNGIDYLKLTRAKDLVKGVGGDIPYYYLPVCTIIFQSDMGGHMEHLDSAVVLRRDDPASEPTRESLLGLDFLTSFRISFTKDTQNVDSIVLEK